MGLLVELVAGLDHAGRLDCLLVVLQFGEHRVAAVEALPLGVRRLDDARTRGAQLLESRSHFGLQALVLEREPRGRGNLIEQLLVDEQTGCVSEHRHRAAVADQGSGLLI